MSTDPIDLSKLTNVSDTTNPIPKTSVLFSKVRDWIGRRFGIVVMWVLIGVMLGSFITYKFFQWRVNESIQVGGFVYEHKVYDVNERLLKK